MTTRSKKYNSTSVLDLDILVGQQGLKQRNTKRANDWLTTVVGIIMSHEEQHQALYKAVYIERACACSHKRALLV
jgi:hypothetical protein